MENSIMFDSDPMVNGKIMRERHAQLIQRVQRESLARELKNAKGNYKTTSPLRAILVTIINLVTR